MQMSSLAWVLVLFVSRCSTHLLRKELHDDTAAQRHERTAEDPEIVSRYSNALLSVKSLVHDAALAAAVRSLRLCAPAEMWALQPKTIA